MVYVVLFLLFAVSGFLLGFGDAGRGSKSQQISVLAGPIWLAGIVYAYFSQGWKFALISFLSSFVISAIFMNIGKNTVLRIRYKDR